MGLLDIGRSASYGLLLLIIIGRYAMGRPLGYWVLVIGRYAIERSHSPFMGVQYPIGEAVL